MPVSRTIPSHEPPHRGRRHRCPHGKDWRADATRAVSSSLGGMPNEQPFLQGRTRSRAWTRVAHGLYVPVDGPDEARAARAGRPAPQGRRLHPLTRCPDAAVVASTAADRAAGVRRAELSQPPAPRRAPDHPDHPRAGHRVGCADCPSCPRSTSSWPSLATWACSTSSWSLDSALRCGDVTQHQLACALPAVGSAYGASVRPLRWPIRARSRRSSRCCAFSTSSCEIAVVPQYELWWTGAWSPAAICASSGMRRSTSTTAPSTATASSTARPAPRSRPREHGWVRRGYTDLEVLHRPVDHPARRRPHSAASA